MRAIFTLFLLKNNHSVSLSARRLSVIACTCAQSLSLSLSIYQSVIRFKVTVS